MGKYLKNAFNSLAFTTIFWGVIGGLALIITPTITTSGPRQVSPYPFVLIAAVLSLTFADKINLIFRKLFLTGLFTFLIMTLFSYLNVLLFINPAARGINLWGHLWRWLFVLALAAASSFIVSIIVYKIFRLQKPALK